MIEKMTEETVSNGFTHSNNPIGGGSNPPPLKKKRNLPGTPDPEAEVISLSPKTLMATNRFLCEICGKGFQRDQNLQLHRRGHNLPWKLKQRTSKEVRKRVYVCPEKTCVHNHPSRALGDLTGIKKHFCRKHGEKKWKCEKCSKRYAVQSDWKAHSKTCGTREYKCDCGTIFSRRDSFITHRAFCDALAEETARITAASNIPNPAMAHYQFVGTSTVSQEHFSSIFKPPMSTQHEIIDPTRRGLSLWLGQGSNQPHDQSIPNNINLQEIHQNMGSLYADPTTYNQLINWDFGHKISSINKTDQDNAKALGNHDLLSVSSLFSTHQTPSANMSATALLQKAAQIGANTTDPSFLGGFGVTKCSGNQVPDGTKYCGLYDTTGLGSDVESSVNEISSLNQQLQMYPSKRRHIQSDQDSNSNNNGGETRDFLGVGIQSICHPPSINGWI